MKRVGYPILWPAVLTFVVGVALTVGGVVLVGVYGRHHEAPSWLGAVTWRLGALMAWAGLLLPLAYDWIRSRTGADDRYLLAEGLADLLEMGLPLDEAMARLGDEMRRNLATSRSRTAYAAVEVARGLGQGAVLSQAVAATGAFPPSWPGLLSAAEALERLPEALRALARLEGRQGLLPGEALVRGAVFLPLAGGLLLFLGVYVLPTFRSLFEGMGWDLPLATRMLVSARYLVAPLLAALMPMAVLVATLCLVRAFRNPLWALADRLATGSRQAQATVLAALAAACRLEMGAPEALRVARSATCDPRFSRALRERPGDTVADVLEAHPGLFPAQVRWMARQGERDGNLAEALAACGQYLEEEGEQVRARRRLLLEVGLTCAMGVILLVMLTGIMMPITQIAVEALLP